MTNEPGWSWGPGWLPVGAFVVLIIAGIAVGAMLAAFLGL